MMFKVRKTPLRGKYLGDRAAASLKTALVVWTTNRAGIGNRAFSVLRRVETVHLGEVQNQLLPVD